MDTPKEAQVRYRNPYLNTQILQVCSVVAVHMCSLTRRICPCPVVKARERNYCSFFNEDVQEFLQKCFHLILILGLQNFCLSGKGGHLE